jgi:hypothetical protein
METYDSPMECSQIIPSPFPAMQGKSLPVKKLVNCEMPMREPKLTPARIITDWIDSGELNNQTMEAR